MGKLTKTADTESESQSENHTGPHTVAQGAMTLKHVTKCREACRNTTSFSTPIICQPAPTQTQSIHDGCVHNNPGVLFGCEPQEKHEQQTPPNGPPREPKP